MSVLSGIDAERWDCLFSLGLHPTSTQVLNFIIMSSLAEIKWIIGGSKSSAPVFSASGLSLQRAPYKEVPVGDLVRQIIFKLEPSM